MNKPNFVNIERFKQKVRNNRANNLTMQMTDLRALDSDIDQMLLYCIHLQEEVIRLKSNEVVKIDLSDDGGDFF